jgi:hypothetical protein
LDEVQTKVSFLLAIHLYFALRFIFLQTHAIKIIRNYFKIRIITVSRVQLLYTVKKKGGKPDRKPYPLSHGLKVDGNEK